MVKDGKLIKDGKLALIKDGKFVTIFDYIDYIVEKEPREAMLKVGQFIVLENGLPFRRDAKDITTWDTLEKAADEVGICEADGAVICEVRYIHKEQP